MNALRSKLCINSRRSNMSRCYFSYYILHQRGYIVILITEIYKSICLLWATQFYISEILKPNYRGLGKNVFSLNFWWMMQAKRHKTLLVIALDAIRLLQLPIVCIVCCNKSTVLGVDALCVSSSVVFIHLSALNYWLLLNSGSLPRHVFVLSCFLHPQPRIALPESGLA